MNEGEANINELEQIKKKKLKELYEPQQRAYYEQAQQESQLQKQIEDIELVVKTILSKEALERYGNLKIAHPDKAVKLLIILGQAIQSGQIKQKVSDAQLKDLLMKLTPPKREYRITKIE